MAIKIRKHGTVTASFATPQEIIIDHANDSIKIGDGTNVMGPLQNVGGVLCFPVSVESIDSTGLALDATLTGGTQRTKITDGVDNAQIDTVGAEKALKVSVISSVGGSAAPSHVDEAAFTQGTSEFTPIGGIYDADGDTVADGKAAALRMTTNRFLMVDVQSSALPSGAATSAKQDTMIGHIDGLEALLGTIDADTSGLFGCVAGSEMQVDIISSALPSGAATAANQSTEITALQLIDDPIFVDDAAFTAATSKVMMIGGQYQSAPNALDDGDAGSILLDASHRPQVVIATALPAGTNAIGKLAANSGVDIGDVDITSVTAAAATNKTDIGLINAVAPLMGNGVTGTGSMRVTIASDNTANSNPWLVSGAAAHDAAVSGNPVRVAGRAMLANGTAVAEDDTTDIATDNQGRVLVTPHVPRDLVVHATGTQSTTTEATILSAVASTFLDVTKIVLTNENVLSSARVQIRDATAGTIRLEMILAPNGGAVLDFGNIPMAQTTANNNWTIDLNAAVSTVYYYIQAIKRIA